jgi:putative DNA modification/repair radical SAM protein
MDISAKVGILADAAKYDASCSTSGSARANTPTGIGSGAVGGICHAWSADGRCVALLKVLLTNACAYDCAYCVNRRTNDIPRAGFEPEELVRLIMDFYRRNYIEGAFLSSGVLGCPDKTMERLIWVARTLRVREKYNGYIHLKIIPGSSDTLVLEAARWADRVSVNIELPSADSLSRIAPDKKPQAILGPMKTLARASGFEPKAEIASLPAPSPRSAFPLPLEAETSVYAARKTRTRKPAAPLLPAGQTTQMVIGASPETDAAILGLAQRLYLALDVRRVYYSAYVPTGSDPRLPVLGKPPLGREHRLYQADWLFRFYGFSAGEILDRDHPFLDECIDPKSDWALRNLQLFPVELKTADYTQLLRVPGIGPKSAARIVAARRASRLTLESLSRLGVVMRRAKWFVSVGGVLASRNDPDSAGVAGRMLERPDFLRDQLLDPAFRRSEDALAAAQPDLPWTDR